jgi:chromosome segregation ATPase
MKKPIIATLIALFMTACVGAAIFTIGGSALLNKNSSPAANSPASATVANTSAISQSDQVAQLQGLISQYQAHEQQYQQREQQLQDQLSQANAQIQTDQQTLQQAQMLLQALQERGVIRISDGRIFINQ